MNVGIRKTAWWMQQLDERILEHLDEDGWSTPQLMANHPNFEQMSASERRIRERCRVLQHAGFVGPEANGYDITNWGLLYLDGQIDARHQPAPPAQRLF